MRTLLVGLAALIFTSASTPEARPALWLLQDADTRIYLFGTVHALPDGLDWRTETFDRAFGRSGLLAVEVLSGTKAETVAPMFRLGLSPGLPPLAERVKPELRPALAALITRSKTPPEALDRMESWMAALILMAPTLAEGGFNPASGADHALIRDARRRNVPVVALETEEQQLGYFDRLTEEDQRLLSTSVVEDAGQARAMMEEMIAAWSKGDVATLARVANDEMKASARLEEVLLNARNRAWAAWLKQRLKTPGTMMMAVGAAHLAGKNSVQAVLARGGLKVTRLQ